MLRTQSANLTEIFKAYRRRDTLDLYLNDGAALHLSRGAVKRGNTVYNNSIRSVEEMRTSIDAGVDRITIHCQNVDSLLGFNLASNLRLLDYATADFGKQYQSASNPLLVEDIPQVFRAVLADAQADEKNISFEVIADYESLGSIIAARTLSPLSPWRALNNIEVTQTPVVANPKTRSDFVKNGREWEFGGWEFFEEPTSILPGGPGNEDGTGRGDCFSLDTGIWTPRGDVPFGEFPLGKQETPVVSFDKTTGEINYEDVFEEIWEHEITRFFTFTFEHSELNVTPEHLLCAAFGKFKPADAFFRGSDTIRAFVGNEWIDARLLESRWNSHKKIKVRNGRVRGNRSYFANRCAVSNSKAPLEVLI